MKKARAYYLDQVSNIPDARGSTFTIIAPRLRNWQPTTNLLLSSSQQLNITRTWIDDDWALNK
ncbi:MAG: hypothetical protein EXR55_03010 [Dehalococcoidia bacterium]|nr:hypothetical protein [Dehalococcoidia bacterium]